MKKSKKRTEAIKKTYHAGFTTLPSLSDSMAASGYQLINGEQLDLVRDYLRRNGYLIKCVFNRHVSYIIVPNISVSIDCHYSRDPTKDVRDKYSVNLAAISKKSLTKLLKDISLPDSRIITWE